MIIHVLHGARDALAFAERGDSIHDRWLYTGHVDLLVVGVFAIYWAISTVIYCWKSFGAAADGV